MTSPVPDSHLWRRVAALERQVAHLEATIHRMSVTRSVTPLSARLWVATLNEAFGATDANYAAADLCTLNGADTNLDVNLFDPLDVFSTLTGVEGVYCLEQIDMFGTRHFIPIQAPCPV